MINIYALNNIIIVIISLGSLLLKRLTDDDFSRLIGFKDILLKN